MGGRIYRPGQRESRARWMDAHHLARTESYWPTLGAPLRPIIRVQRPIAARRDTTAFRLGDSGGSHRVGVHRGEPRRPGALWEYRERSTVARRALAAHAGVSRRGPSPGWPLWSLPAASARHPPAELDRGRPGRFVRQVRCKMRCLRAKPSFSPRFRGVVQVPYPPLLKISVNR
jgi:hypothetical protein